MTALPSSAEPQCKHSYHTYLSFAEMAQPLKGCVCRALAGNVASMDSSRADRNNCLKRSLFKHTLAGCCGGNDRLCGRCSKLSSQLCNKLADCFEMFEMPFQSAALQAKKHDLVNDPQYTLT